MQIEAVIKEAIMNLRNRMNPEIIDLTEDPNPVVIPPIPQYPPLNEVDYMLATQDDSDDETVQLPSNSAPLCNSTPRPLPKIPIANLKRMREKAEDAQQEELWLSQPVCMGMGMGPNAKMAKIEPTEPTQLIPEPTQSTQLIPEPENLSEISPIHEQPDLFNSDDDSDNSDEDSFVDDRDEDDLTVEGKSIQDVCIDLRHMYPECALVVRTKNFDVRMKDLMMFERFQAMDEKISWYYDIEIPPAYVLEESLHAMWERITLREYCEEYVDLYNHLNHD